MFMIRLARKGRTKSPFYRIVAIDNKKPREGKANDVLGFYNPIKNLLKINIEKWDSLIKNGAQPSKTAYFLNKKFRKQLSKKEN